MATHAEDDQTRALSTSWLRIHTAYLKTYQQQWVTEIDGARESERFGQDAHSSMVRFEWFCPNLVRFGWFRFNLVRMRLEVLVK